MKIGNKIVKMVEGRFGKINRSIMGICYSNFYYRIKKYLFIFFEEIVRVYFVCV